MGHFLRIRKCCFCCGGLRGGSIAIGVFYLLTALFGATLDDTIIYFGSTSNNYYTSYISPVGPCAEIPFLRIWKFCSLVSVFINLIMVYGALTKRELLVAPWLAWHLALPFVQFSVIVWSIIELSTCRAMRTTDLAPIVITVLSIYTTTLLLLLYFATVVYSLYKDLSEANSSNAYGTQTLLPSKNWDAALVPYTNYDPDQATPTAWGYLQPQQQIYQGTGQRMPPPPPPPPPQQQRQKPGIPRPQSQFTA
ncbi:uncharacterized protein LOC110840279 [Zootermopsis nevadensis]|uniref:uncharacterized protein LOC110840279 n=1 Tax=Zootermopsis nevadensis TaxID=136037 RepID=UPI000B8EE711|nr:uncharacterized protein LOC110840279 [Zootermopsis nevadensis]